MCVCVCDIQRSTLHLASWKLALGRLLVNPILRVWRTATALSPEVPANGGLSGAGLFHRLWHVLIRPQISCIKYVQIPSKIVQTFSSLTAFQNIAAHVLRSHRRVDDATNVKPIRTYNFFSPFFIYNEDVYNSFRFFVFFLFISMLYRKVQI